MFLLYTFDRLMPQQHIAHLDRMENISEGILPLVHIWAFEVSRDEILVALNLTNKRSLFPSFYPSDFVWMLKPSGSCLTCVGGLSTSLDLCKLVPATAINTAANLSFFCNFIRSKEVDCFFAPAQSAIGLGLHAMHIKIQSEYVFVRTIEKLLSS